MSPAVIVVYDSRRCQDKFQFFCLFFLLRNSNYAFKVEDSIRCDVFGETVGTGFLLTYSLSHTILFNFAEVLEVI
jgi:hypothetical protein